ncbi:MAG: gamma-glutamyl kinase [Pseudomonadota bacterium]
MLVFSKEKLVFLSVPKTGSTAYQDALAPHASLVVRDPPELKHAPVFRYNRFFRPALEKFCDGPFDIVAVMREPVDWLGSWYRYRARDELRGVRTSTAEITFEAFIEGYLAKPRPAFAQVGSQAKFLESQKNGTAVTHLFRYDDQAGLQSFLDNRLNRPVQPARRNASPAAPLTLSEGLHDRLRQAFAADFTLYDGISEEGAYIQPERGTAQPHR